MKKARSNEVELTQYLRPNGTPTKVFAPVGEDYVAKAKNLVLSAEVLTTGEVVIYARRRDESDEKEINEIATNGPGEKSPTACLKHLIDRLGSEQ